MNRDTIIRLVTETMQHYGSDAGERSKPGSKLQFQAEHIADVIEQYHEACRLIGHLEHVTVSVREHYLAKVETKA